MNLSASSISTSQPKGIFEQVDIDQWPVKRKKERQLSRASTSAAPETVHRLYSFSLPTKKFQKPHRKSSLIRSSIFAFDFGGARDPLGSLQGDAACWAA
jgi:hypothetical protein